MGSFDVVEIGSEPRSASLLAVPHPSGTAASLKALLGQDDWDVIRKFVYVRAGRACQACGGVGDDWPVAAHPVWEFDPLPAADSGYGVQKLADVVALCPSCLKVVMVLRAAVGEGCLDADLVAATAQVATVEGISIDEVMLGIDAARVASLQLASIPWALDLSWLYEVGPLRGRPVLDDVSACEVVNGVVMGGLR